ncbi:MAG: tyrosine-type recombinase/integrase [bacterium]|nr:tyrosine-type recombinase/integrase [bacterium]
MKRPTTLNATFVKAVRQPGRYGDGHGGHGLTILVKQRKNGRLSKTWAQRIRIHGRETNLGLGAYPAVTLAEARRRALRNRQAIEEGRNPRENRIPTFHHAAETVIALHSTKWKPGGLTETHWRSSLNTYARPKLGSKQVDRITSRDVLDCLSPIWTAKPETARKVRRRIAAVMKWAIAQGYREDNPADERIPAALGNNRTPPQHARSLHHSQVATAIRTIENTGAHWATIAAFKLLILTAARSGEIRNATWDEIDLNTQVWTIPARKTKTGRRLRIPLSTTAIHILKEAHHRNGGVGLVFPSPRGKVMSDATMSKLCKENSLGCVPHGMRSSFRDWCSDTGTPREIAEQALGHTVKGVEGAYARSDLLELRRPIMQNWAQYLHTTSE